MKSRARNPYGYALTLGILTKSIHHSPNAPERQKKAKRVKAPSSDLSQRERPARSRLLGAGRSGQRRGAQPSLSQRKRS